eukprot:scaffold56179_cov81-Cyclotella_meneghiniana.AAC.2
MLGISCGRLRGSLLQSMRIYLNMMLDYYNYKKFGKGSTVARKLWLRQMKMRLAIIAADLVSRQNHNILGRKCRSALSLAVACSYDQYRHGSGIPITACTNIAKWVQP